MLFQNNVMLFVVKLWKLHVFINNLDTISNSIGIQCNIAIECGP